MKKPNHGNSSSRRSFLRNATLTAMGLLVLSRSGARKNIRRTTSISCAPQATYALTGTITSIQSGKWTDPATWGGRVPGPSDTPLIAAGHTVIFDAMNAEVAGISISREATLSFDSRASVTFQSTQNIIVEGTLQMRPVSSYVIHTLRFSGIDEDRFVGGGMEVLPTDVGLWVMASGRLDITGTKKTSWTKLAGSAAPGSTGILLKTSPANWQKEDEIVITPTESAAEGNEAFLKGFDHAHITAVRGAQVSLANHIDRHHPIVNGQWTAEVMNLTRNVRIEGTASGRSHIFIRSTSPQIIKYTAIRFMGPRKDRSGDGVEELVPGRYGMHFHHCYDGSRGSQVEGNVIRDTDNHSYVPHLSHGITLADNIAYNVTEMAFWWDPGDPTHDCIYDHNIVARCKFVSRSKDMNAEDAPTFASSGFAMNSGDGNICRNNVAVGTIGDPELGGGFNWEAVLNEGVWKFTNNLAHNCNCGIRIWQNSSLNHTIEDFTGYHNGIGIFHGAYANRYNYNGGILYGNGLEIKAASLDTNRVRFENMTIDGAGLIDYCIRVLESPLDGEVPVFLRNLTLKGHRKAAITNESPDKLKSIDVIACMISGLPFYMQDGISPKEEIRVQPLYGRPFAIKRADQAGDMIKEWNGRRRQIEAFAPTIWGNGNGLTGEYYNGSNFNTPAFKRIDPNISFYEWSKGVHHAVKGDQYSIRWTGQIQPQYSESYTFSLGSGGGHRLWVDGKLILDSWEEHDLKGYRSQSIALQAGKKYDIRLEFFNNNNKSGIGLAWESGSLPLEYVPQSQLYTGA